MRKSNLEILAKVLLDEIGDFKEEYKFHQTRKWRFDFCEVNKKIAIEIEGGTYSGGRHTRGSGFEKDCEKYNEANLMGFRIYRFTRKMIEDGALQKIIKQALKNNL